MDPSYKTIYGSKKLNPHNLRTKISNLFSNFPLHKHLSFDEILFILDQKCAQGKCDRDVARELFQQSSNSENKATLNEIIFKYVENLQTSKLCLVREACSQNRIQSKLNGLKNRRKSYVYIKIIQATVHARYSTVPSFSYKIFPSDLPPVTVVNSLNPLLNHEYTLEMETNAFKIIFYESGVEIEEWQWPDCEEAMKEGEYHRNIMAQRISFEVKIRYKPMDSNPHRESLQSELQNKKSLYDLEGSAFNKLCEFEPFLDPELIRPVEGSENTRMHEITQKLFEFIPFLRKHVRNLYYVLIGFIVIECLASISWSMEFIDIALAFASIAMLFDQGEVDLGMQMLVTIMGMLLLIVKTIWGAVVADPTTPHIMIFLILAVVGKIVVIFFAWIVSVRKQEVPEQRKLFFYDGVDPKIVVAPPMQDVGEAPLSIYY